MPGNSPWSEGEFELLEKFFDNSITEMTLFQRIHKLNPYRTYEAMTRKLRYMKANGWERNKAAAIKSLRIGYLDIETTNLNANFGFILTWYIKTRDKNEYQFGIINRNEIFDGKFDKRLVKELLNVFKFYDVIYTHYGSDRRFDVPFIRTRAFANGLQNQLPKYMEKFIMDTYPTARNKLRLHSNRLDSIAEALGIEGIKKTPLSPKKWRMAAIGDSKALQYIAKHNKRDVQLLERVHKKYEEGNIERPIYRSM